MTIQKWHRARHIFSTVVLHFFVCSLVLKDSGWQDWRTSHLFAATEDMQHRTSCLCQCASALAQGDPSPRVRAQLISCTTVQSWPLCQQQLFLWSALVVLSHGCLSTRKWTQTTHISCLSRTLPYFHFHKKKNGFHQQNIVGWYFFSFHMDVLSILWLPQGWQERWTEIISFNSKGRQEVFIYALISMHISEPFKVFDYNKNISVNSFTNMHPPSGRTWGTYNCITMLLD